MTGGEQGTGMGRAETALLVGFSLVSFVYGVAQLLDVITYRLPGVVYLVAGVVLFLWGVSLNRRS